MKNLILNNIYFLKWNLLNLIPVIIQEVLSNNLLMFAYFNQESLNKTLIFFNLYYFSRSKNKLWFKGFNSKNIQYLKYFYLDCDMDVILFKIFQIYNICCHTGSFTCFYNYINFL